MKGGTFLFHLINFEGSCEGICMTMNKSFSYFYGETFLLYTTLHEQEDHPFFPPVVELNETLNTNYYIRDRHVRP